MSISNISGNSYAQAIDPQEMFTRWAGRKLHASGDSVSISEEGRARAEELAKAMRDAEENTSGREAGGARTEGASAGGGSDASSAVGQSDEEQTQDLESKVKALMDQLMNIMQSSLSPEEKMQQAQPIQQMISQMQTQMQALKNQMAKEG